MSSAPSLLSPPRGQVARGRSRTSGLDRAILRAIAYADVFEHPLTASEVHRYLIGRRVTRRAVRAALARALRESGGLTRSGRFFMLRGREALAAVRERRAVSSARLWPRAVRYGAVMACLPFVRMVAVTGSVAANNARDDADIDYFIVTKPGRLWLGRLATLVVAKLASRRGCRLCINYLLSERALGLRERTPYVARELFQMVPLCGQRVYERLRVENAWAQRMLPNAATAATTRALRAIREPALPLVLLQRLVESCLGGFPGTWLERREMAVQRAALAGTPDPCRETRFSGDEFKAHFSGHGRRTLVAWRGRLKRLEAGPR